MAPNTREVGKLTRCISKMVQKDIVFAKDEYEVACAVSSGNVVNDLA